MKKLIYVIGAYSGDTHNNILEAEKVSIELIKRGYHVITPHKNTSGYEKYEDGNLITYQTWIEMDLDILSRCDAIFIIDNAKYSKGSQIEIDFAQNRGIPIIKL